MFDLTSSKLLILGIVALLVVGPKDLPLLLRTIGKYVGMIKRQAAEFRSQFDEAIRDSEIEQLKKDVEKITSDVETTVREAETSVHAEMNAVRSEIESATDSVAHDPYAHDANGVALSNEGPAEPLSPIAAAAAAAAAASSAAPATAKQGA